jgi:hypothetical protein
MPLHRASLRALGAVALLALALACGGKKEAAAPVVATTVKLSGTVTYTRIPLVVDANGVPTGLADPAVPANLTTKPVKGVTIRVYQRLEELNPDGTTKTTLWQLFQSSFTDAEGKYALMIPKDKAVMVELLSTFDGGGSGFVNLVGDPVGITSPKPQAERYRYALRKAVDGTAPIGNSTPAAIATTDRTVDFSLGLSDAWWLVNPVYNHSNKLATAITETILETDLPGRTTGTGSRVLAIGASLSTFVNAYGSATPGNTLDLHYAPGVTEPRGSFVEYDSSQFPLAFDAESGSSHFFGALRGGPINDDAWDEGVIFPLLARSALFNGARSSTFGLSRTPLFPSGHALSNLSPDQARIEGLAEVMAANLLKSPYLADTQPLGPASYVAINVPGTADLSPFSAPAIRALGWDLILKANSLPNPGTPTNWATIKPEACFRLFARPALASGTTHDAEPLNLYSQLGRLKEAKTGAEPVDLAAIFTDATLTALTTPYNIPWPRPTAASDPYTKFAADWGTTSATQAAPIAPPILLSMAQAVQVNGSYPNLSQGEVFYTGFSLDKDRRYVISATISPGLAVGGEVLLDIPTLSRTFSFAGTGGSQPVVTIPVSTTPPVFFPARVCLKSPTTLQANQTVTITFTPSL